jgi:hypothetical protein
VLQAGPQSNSVRRDSRSMNGLALLRPAGRKNVRPRMNWEPPAGDEKSPMSTPAGGAPGHRLGLFLSPVASSLAHVASVLLASPGGLLRLPRSTPQLGRLSSSSLDERPGVVTASSDERRRSPPARQRRCVRFGQRSRDSKSIHTQVAVRQLEPAGCPNWTQTSTDCSVTCFQQGP